MLLRFNEQRSSGQKKCFASVAVIASLLGFSVIGVTHLFAQGAGATILGRIVIGRGSTIGGNVWLTHGVAPGSQITQAHARSNGHATELPSALSE